MGNNLKFWKSVKPYPPQNYLDERLDKLVTIGILKLDKANIESSFENIAVVLLKLFPDKFSLTYFPEYPDSLRVDNTLRLDCKHSGFVEGSRKKGIYVLTGRGQLSAEETLEKIESEKHTSKSSSDLGRNKYIKLIRGVTKTTAFKKFSSQDAKNINKFDVCESLHCTIDSDDDHIKSNLKLLMSHAHQTRKIASFEKISQSVMNYLQFVESHWDELMR